MLSLRKMKVISLWRHVFHPLTTKITMAVLETGSARGQLKGRYALGVYTKHAQFLPSVKLKFLAPSLAFHQVFLCSSLSASVGLLADSAFSLFKAETIHLAYGQGFRRRKPTYVL